MLAGHSVNVAVRKTRRNANTLQRDLFAHEPRMFNAEHMLLDVSPGANSLSTVATATVPLTLLRRLSWVR
jgi:hypothetical protein